MHYSLFLYYIFALVALLPAIDSKKSSEKRNKNSSKRPNLTTPQPKILNECEKNELYFRNRYNSLIRINVTTYPIIERCNTCSKIVFGKKIWNHYEYLENLQGKKTLEFVKNLNKISNKYLNQISIRSYIKRKIVQYYNYGKHSLFSKHGEYYYYTYKPPKKDHAILLRKYKYYYRGEVVFDVDKFDKTGKTSTKSISLPKNGKYIALLLSVNGSDWGTIRFMTNKGETLTNSLKNIKFTNMEFAYSGKGFFYSTFVNEKGQVVSNQKEKNVYHALLYHKMGRCQEDDIIIADYKEIDNMIILGSVSNDERYLFVYYYKGSSRENMIYYLNLSKFRRGKIHKKPKLKPLFTDFDGTYSIINTNCDELIVLTTKDAPTGKIIKVNIKDAHKGIKKWKTLIEADPKRKIKNVEAGGQKYLIVHYSENLKDRVYIYNKNNGKMITKLDLDSGSVVSISASPYYSRFFIKVSNQVIPQIIYTGNLMEMKHGKRKVTMRVIIKTTLYGIEKQNFVMKTEYYKSKDGTMIPMFIFHKKGIKLNGRNPVLLEGYGGFGVSFLPTFSSSNLMFVNHLNGIYVIACIRGGGEYGKKWHDAGKHLNKQNSFDDFIAAAEYLINEKYTNPSKLAISGSSNGGLLTAVVSQQRPELFGTVIIGVGVLDMIRYHNFTFGAAWKSEYGDPEKEEDFNYLLNYSPLNNLKMPKRPIQWPSTLITTGLNDDRVVASHSLKYAAELYYTIQKGIRYQEIQF
uniref:Prolyl endopeptidase n=1 Tax=Strongyloides ratti TaxID=34506 RepID=B5TSQ3_STRRB|nr:prolyl-oligopeptidase [Strongyloides ratti]